ncbi:MAG: C4-dicarboxylate ABC transporter [marine bacterium B5-7]|nr:MAG: C4-dicarboxylate ABC transporter [marine bacterium B5-7]
MNTLLWLSGLVDSASTAINRFLRWTILVIVFISAGNAVSRKFFDLSSNAFLEIQWYLFSAVFLLGAGYVFLRNDHVRVDVLSQRLTPSARALVDLAGIVFFLIPFCVFIVYQSTPIVAEALRSGEISQNAGGLLRWPVYFLLPLGYVLLLVQSLSEAIKRLAFLLGIIADPAPLSDPTGHDDVLGS